jgi:hypothetical protein
LDPLVLVLLAALANHVHLVLGHLALCARSHAGNIFCVRAKVMSLAILRTDREDHGRLWFSKAVAHAFFGGQAFLVGTHGEAFLTGDCKRRCF